MTERTTQEGQRLGNYRVIRLLGQGATASVYLAEHVHLGTQAAIKVLTARLVSEEGEQFRQEARTIARLEHPHIVRVLDFGVEDSIPFLVMAYAPGGTLRQRHPKGTRLPLDTVVAYVSQVVQALQYAHHQKLIHRDIKPENLLLGHHHEILLSDFGLAVLAHSARSQPAQETAGTMAYMAPEQIQGHPSPASDQYALGIVVYEWLCGDRPFHGTWTELGTQHLFTPPPPLQEKVPTIAPAVEQAVLRALAKDPQQRFAQVQDFARALEEASKAESSGQTHLLSSDLFPHSAAEIRRATKHNLPVQLTPLIGREQIIAAACALLRQPEVRLLTLTGPGGIGKTRVGLQVAADVLTDFADGVCFVALAPISDPELVVATITQELGLKEAGGQPLLALLKASLQDKHLLLLLDNFEHVVAAAPQLADLLTACPHLKILVTSRAVLHLRGEHEFPVPPLALPDLARLPESEALAQYAAVELFVQRARATRPDMQITPANARALAEICVHLDGLPLAIELAAARSKLLSPQALLVRLGHRLTVLTSEARDVPARQQTLRNTIAWSYELLPPQEQRLFRRLSVFAGGCTLHAVEALGSSLDDEAVSALDGVTSLLDKSLLQPVELEGEETRVMMLETIREYALETLSASGDEEATRRAHADYYLQLAEEAAPKLHGVEEHGWFDRLERDHENMRAALYWLIERKEAELAMRLCIALSFFWLRQGYLSEGRIFLEKALSGSEEDVTSVRALTLDLLGAMLEHLGDFEQAEKLCGESLSLYRELGDLAGIASSLQTLGLSILFQGEYTRARALFEESLARYSEAGDEVGCADLHYNLAMVYSVQGEYARALACAQESLARWRKLGENTRSTDALFWLAKVLFVSQGSTAAVDALVEECLTRSKDNYKWGIADALHLGAQVALKQGNVAKARTLLEESLTFYKAKGLRAEIAESLIVFGQITTAEGDNATARAFYEECLALDYKPIIPAALEGLASVATAQEEPGRAARLWGAAEALRETFGAPLPPVERPGYEQAVSAARTQLGALAFADAWAEGRTMMPEQALAAQERTIQDSPAHPAQPLTRPGKSTTTYPDGLTAREVEVLCLIAQGLTDAQVAERLVISRRTVHTHLNSIYSKLAVNSRSAATRYAI